MSRVEAYLTLYNEYIKQDTRESVWWVMDDERELDDLWDNLSPEEQFNIRTDLGLVRGGEKMTPVNRYLNVWRQLCDTPVPDRPADLRQEMDRVWEELTLDDKNEIGKVLEAETWFD